MMHQQVLADIELCLLELKNGNTSNTVLQRLRNNLNKISKARCEKVLYTNNTDKLFFGMSVIPVLNEESVYNIICTDTPVKVEKYYLEIDSKLFTSGVDLNGRELTAIILHEVGHIEGYDAAEEIRTAIDEYLALSESSISVSNVKKFYMYYKFGIMDAYQKICNIFNSNVQEEINADTFVVKLGYGEYLESALNKIYRGGLMLNSDVNNKFIVLGWIFRICKDFNISRIPTIRRLERAYKLSASQLEKDEISDIVKELKGQKTPFIREAAQTYIEERAKSFLGKFKYKGIRGFEDDLAEFKMRSRNIDREDEAILLIRSINSRMGIIDDYICSEDMEEEERKRWEELYRQYNLLRAELSDKRVYRNKNFNIYVNYPDIEPRF